MASPTTLTEAALIVSPSPREQTPCVDLVQVFWLHKLRYKAYWMTAEFLPLQSFGSKKIPGFQNRVTCNKVSSANLESFRAYVQVYCIAHMHLAYVSQVNFWTRVFFFLACFLD